MNKYIIIAAGALLLFGFFALHEPYEAPGVGFASLPSIVANRDTKVQVGPQQNIRVVATTTNRNFLRLENDTLAADVYCSADGDKIAVSGEGIKLSSSTPGSPFFEFDESLPYDGSVRCTAVASTSVSIVEYLIR